MSTEFVPDTAPGNDAPQRPWRDRKRYLWPLATLMPAMPFVGAGLSAATGWAGWWWVGPMILFVILPGLDLVFGATTAG
jgi:alkane 1-monooxygenase